MALSTFGKVVISGALLTALIAVFLPEEYMPHQLQASVSSCPMGYGEDSDVLLPEDHPRVLMMGGQPFKSPPRRMQPDALVFALYHNAAIWSGDEEAQGSLKDAMVVYVNEGTVLGVGSQNNMEDLVESAMSVYEAVGKVHLERVDLAGCFVMPSFIDQAGCQGAVCGGSDGFQAALQAHTSTAAHLLGLHEQVGTLGSGMRANFIVLDSSPMDMKDASPTPIIVATLVDGKCAFQNPASKQFATSVCLDLE